MSSDLETIAVVFFAVIGVRQVMMWVLGGFDREQ